MCKPEEEQSLLGAQVGGVEVEAEEKKNEGEKEDQNRGVEVMVVEEEVNEDCCTKSWLVVLASCLCICMLDGSMYSNGVYTKTLVKALDSSETGVAGATSVEVAVSSFIAPLTAWLTDRYGPKRVALSGAIIAAGGWFVASFATGLWGLIIGQSLLTGFGFGLMYIPGVVAVAGVFSKRRSLAIGLALSGSGLGQVALGPLAGLLLRDLGWENAFRVMGGLCVCCGAAGLLMPTPRANTESEDEIEDDDIEVARWKVIVFGRAVALQQHVWIFFLYALGDFLAVMALYIPYSCIPELAQFSGISETYAPVLIAAMGLGSVFGRLGAGQLCDQPWVHPLHLTRLALMVAAPVMFIYPFMPPFFLVLAGLLLLLGLATGAWISATSPLLVNLLGLPQLGTAFGRLTFLRGAAALISPPLAATLAEHYGVRLLPLYLSAGFFAASALTFSLSVFIYDRKMKKYSEYEQI